MNILNFEKWNHINEKFNAEIKDIEKNDKTNDIKDSIVVKETENSEPVIYSIDGDSITSIQNQTGVDDTSSKKEVKEVTDIHLKSDIKKAAYAIRDIKDRLRAKEILRVTGGDISDETDAVRKIIDSFHQTQEQSFEITNNKSNSSFSLDKTIKTKNNLFTYIEIKQNKKWKGKYNITYNDIKDIYNKSFNSVGKGEYLLPLLFDDVYKIPISSKEKGDNYFIDEYNKKYFIEVKGPSAFGKFSDYKKHGGGVVQYLNNTKLIKTPDNIENIYKTAISASLLDYAHKQFRDIYYGGYLCLFTEKEPEIKNKSKRITSPTGMLLINVSNIKDSDIHINKILNDQSENNNTESELLEQIKNRIDIVVDAYDTQVGADFVYSCVGDENPRIKCKLNYEHMKILREILQLPYIEKRKPGGQSKKTFETNDIKNEIQNESLILSRDNFVNEIYTK